MPKRNLVIVCLLVVACLVAWAARDRNGRGRLFAEATGYIERMHLDPVDEEALFRAAMDGMFSKLDEHSAYVVAEQRQNIDGELSGEFVGVGLELAADSGRRWITVTTPVADSPAWRAGIAAGDRVLAIDGRSTDGMLLKDAVAALRGAVGSRVAVEVVPPEAPAGELSAVTDASPQESLSEQQTFSLERSVVRALSVSGDRRLANGAWDWMLEGEDRIALVRISKFGQHTLDELAVACAALVAAGPPAGIILDLRGNSGGLMAVAIEVCDQLIDDGVIVSTRRRPAAGTRPMPAAVDQIDVRRATPGALLRDVPMVVLIDGLTASAAEIVAACLQDNGRAVLVGSRTYGKGTVQSFVPLSDGRSVLKLTTSEYLRPNRATIHRSPDDTDGELWGVTPDRNFEITPTGITLERIRDWRRQRDAVPRFGGPSALDIKRAESAIPSTGGADDGSAAALPRHIDPVIGRGLGALAIQRASQPAE